MQVLKIVYSFHFFLYSSFFSTKVNGSNKPLSLTGTQSIKQYEMHKNMVWINDSWVFFNWDSLHIRLNSQYESWSYQKKKLKKIKRLFTHEISSRMKLVPGWNHSCLWWNVSYCLHVFAEMKFHPGMKDRWDFILGWKKEKKICKHLIRGWNFKISMFLINFWHIYSNKLSKVNVFEHNESMNVVNIRPLFKKWSLKRKRMRTTSKRSKM